MSRGSDARRLVRKFASGVLATQSLKVPGYPYASSLPFCTDQRGRVVVLIPEIEPQKWRHQILQNQRGLILANRLRRETDAVVARLPFHLREDSPSSEA